MGNATSIQSLSLAEKIQLMEALWTDLCRSGDELASPEWHRQVLADRQQRVDRGEATFEDWESAKKSIRDATS